jgi:hypothetical protein
MNFLKLLKNSDFSGFKFRNRNLRFWIKLVGYEHALLLDSKTYAVFGIWNFEFFELRLRVFLKHSKFCLE